MGWHGRNGFMFHSAYYIVFTMIDFFFYLMVFGFMFMLFIGVGAASDSLDIDFMELGFLLSIVIMIIGGLGLAYCA